MRLIHHFLEESAKQFPDKVTLIHNEVPGHLFRSTLAEMASPFFLELDIGLPWCQTIASRYVVGYYGILKAGGVAVPINTDIKPEGLKQLLKDIEPKIIISVHARIKRQEYSS